MISRRSGAESCCSTAGKLWRAGNHSELVLPAIEDVTERKRLEDELVRSNEDMQRFAYVAAHDLRSPLNSALKLCTLAARRLEGTVGKRKRTSCQ